MAMLDGFSLATIVECAKGSHEVWNIRTQEEVQTFSNEKINLLNEWKDGVYSDEWILNDRDGMYRSISATQECLAAFPLIFLENPTESEGEYILRIFEGEALSSEVFTFAPQKIHNGFIAIASIIDENVQESFLWTNTVQQLTLAEEIEREARNERMRRVFDGIVERERRQERHPEELVIEIEFEMGNEELLEMEELFDIGGVFEVAIPLALIAPRERYVKKRFRRLKDPDKAEQKIVQKYHAKQLTKERLRARRKSESKVGKAYYANPMDFYYNMN
jgi:hypothetical protein